MTADGYERLRDRFFTGTTGTDLGLFAYGSLIVRRELASVFDMAGVSVRAVRVNGLRRAFNVDVSRWLENPDPPATAVLNVEKADDFWCNGVLVDGLERDDFRRYAEREFGYWMTRLSTDDIRFYAGGSIRPRLEVYTCYVPRVHVEDGLAGYPSYRQRCLEGARSWGDSFYRDFCRTTHTHGDRLVNRLSEDESTEVR